MTALHLLVALGLAVALVGLFTTRRAPPPPAHELRIILGAMRTILLNQGAIMSALDDLNKAAADLADAAAAQIAAYKDAQANRADPAVDVAIEALVVKVNDVVTALKASVAPAPEAPAG